MSQLPCTNCQRDYDLEIDDAERAFVAAVLQAELYRLRQIASLRRIGGGIELQSPNSALEDHQATIERDDVIDDLSEISLGSLDSDVPPVLNHGMLQLLWHSLQRYDTETRRAVAARYPGCHPIQ